MVSMSTDEDAPVEIKIRYLGCPLLVPPSKLKKSLMTAARATSTFLCGSLVLGRLSINSYNLF